MKELQNKIKKFCKHYDMEYSVETRVLDTLSELGEVAKEILKSSDYGRKTIECSNELKYELGDVLFSLITIANTFDIDLEESLNLVLDKYERRLQKGSAGSEND